MIRIFIYLPYKRQREVIPLLLQEVEISISFRNQGSDQSESGLVDTSIDKDPYEITAA